jgi:DNA repair protein RadC
MPLSIPLEERPRERLAALGADSLSEIELLAILLTPGARGASGEVLARRLVASFSGLQEMADASPGELAAVTGVGPARAARIRAAFALGARLKRPRLLGTAIRSAGDVFAWAAPSMGHRRQEVFVALALDARHRVVRAIEIAVGSLSAVDVHPREVYRPLIREAAAAAIVLHNHPSGDPTPSADDLRLTERLREAGALVGIPLLDHVVVAADRYVSLAERGML